MSTSSAEVPSLAEAFTHEHHQIDAGIEEYLQSEEEFPARAAPLLSAMEALRRHIYLEEEIVFPHITDGSLMMAMMVMYREHGQLWRQMDGLAVRLNAPDSSVDELDSACTELLALLDKHNEKEEPIIYPHMDTDLDETERKRVRELLGDGVLPEGWVCREARK